MLVKGHTTDPVQVWMYQTLTTLSTMLLGHVTRVPLWQETWEAMRRRRVGPRTEGLTAKATRVSKRMGWTWESAVELRTRDGEKMHVRYWKHKIREAAREWRLRQATTRMTARDLEKVDIQMFARLLRGRTLTDIQGGPLRAILAGVVHTGARNVGKRKIGDTVPSLWLRA